MKLISMTEFVLNIPSQGMEVQSIGIQGNNRYQKCIRYANFLSQKLELWMFVPCKLVNGVWVVLKEPNRKNFYIIGFEKVMKEYQEAKDRVLFGGFAYDKMGFAYSTIQKECGFDEEYMENKTIEDLVKYNLELTPTAKKQIGL